MFDILMQYKHVHLINEHNLISTDYLDDRRIIKQFNDPIESEMLRFNKDNCSDPEQADMDINNNRLIIKFLGWNPKLFNKIDLKTVRG